MTTLPIIWRPQRNHIYQMDALQFAWQIESRSVQTVITSPPYFGLRDYGIEGQWGSEPTIQVHIDRIVKLFRAIREALRDDGTVWLNYGDGYAATVRGKGGDGYQNTNKDSHLGNKSWYIPDGLKPKDLIGMPWRVALALQADGWYLRSDIIWHKPNPMPESVTDRPTKAHEYIFLLAKSERYYYDADTIREPHVEPWRSNSHESNNAHKGRLDNKDVAGYVVQTRKYNPLGRNARTVWAVPTQPFPGAHFAVFPEALIKPCVLAGAPLDGLVYDPFMGAGTTAIVARSHGRDFIGSEINPEYIELANARLDGSIKRLVRDKNSVHDFEGLPLFEGLI